LLQVGPAKKVAIYIGEDHQYHGTALYAAILDFLFFRGVAGATVTRGLAGFGADHHLHTTRILRLTENLPIKIEFIESPAKVDEVLPKLYEMAGTGLIELQDTTILKPSAPAAKHAGGAGVPSLRSEGKAKLMRIYIGESDRWHDKPLHEALVQACRTNDIAGVTVYRAIMGYGAHGKLHHGSALGISHDRPILLSIIDKEEKLRLLLPLLDEMIQQGLVVLSDVDVIKYTHNYVTADRRKEIR